MSEQTAATVDGVHCDVLVIGAGAAGLIAALRAKHCGADVLVVERDPLPRGSTALSAGLIPAAGTRFQRAVGISDTVATFSDDIVRKSAGEADAVQARALAGLVGEAIEWLADLHGLPFSVIGDFTYPGHSARRMHGLPTRSGAELMDALRAAAERADIVILSNARATEISHRGGRVTSVAVARPDGSSEHIACKTCIFASNGYGGDKALVAKYIPELADALYFGHPGNRGDALRWGTQLGAATRHLSGYQGHGSVAHPHGILITWATIMEGGFQVNAEGVRFTDESHGYSEQAAKVLAQPDGVAWSMFDTRIAAIARQFEDYRNAEAQGATIAAETVAELAQRCRLPLAQLEATWSEVDRLKRAASTDSFGRNWAGVGDLVAPFVAVRVTGALFHTQGGLVVDATGRVLDKAGQPLPNVFAAGGSACGVSGSEASGYLSGNGLLSAVGYGFASGAAAAQLALGMASKSPLA